jgi:hypothetical protein
MSMEFMKEIISKKYHVWKSFFDGIGGVSAYVNYAIAYFFGIHDSILVFLE